MFFVPIICKIGRVAIFLIDIYGKIMKHKELMVYLFTFIFLRNDTLQFIYFIFTNNYVILIYDLKNNRIIVIDLNQSSVIFL